MAFTLSVAEVIAADTSGLLSKHESWERVPLAEIASVLNGAPFDSALFNSNEGMPLVRIRDVLSGQTSTYYTGSYEDTYVVEPGDLLIGMDGDFNCGYWKAQRSVLNQRVCKITPNEFFYDKRLLAYALPGYLAAINANTPSVTVKHLSSKTIGEIDLPLPPRSEQTRIVEKLEELLSDLDAGVAELKAVQKKLVQYRQSLLKAAVEGKLTQHWREQRSAPSPQPLSHQGRGAQGAGGVEEMSAVYRQPLQAEKSPANLSPLLAETPLILRDQPQTTTLPSPLVGEGPGERGQEAFETGAQLLARILKQRRTHWEAKQLAKFQQQGKTPPKGWQDKYPEPVKPNTSDLPELPEGWVWASLDQLTSMVRNGLSQKPSQEPIGFPILRINAVRPMSVNLDEVRYLQIPESIAADYFLENGDLLATRYNGSVDLLGVFGVVRSLTTQTLYPDKLIRIKPVLECHLANWIEISAATFESRRHIISRVKTTAGQTGISGEDVKKMPIPLPPLAEQLFAIDDIKKLLPEISAQTNYVERTLKQSAAQRQNILRAAFSGQLVPQDPNDEPASVLLERIRAERAIQQAAKAPKKRSTKTS